MGTILSLPIFVNFLGDCNANVDMFFIDTTPFVNEYWENNTQNFDWRGLAPRAEQLQSQLQVS